MLVFPNSKINLGLHVIEKREDGFHNIETVFCPVKWCDALEVIENKESKEDFILTFSGTKIIGALETNLIFRAWKLIRERKEVPAVRVHLHKNIPMGAGLGGGSSDAAFFINLMNNAFDLRFSWEEKIDMGSQLGSDCSFFIKNKTCFASGKGNELSDINVDLSTYYILLVYTNKNSNTREAYEGLIPKKHNPNLRNIFNTYRIGDWKNVLTNDFETSIFKRYPEIENLKKLIYDSGAIYASMSGSGSSVFGIFKEEPSILLPTSYQHCLQKPLAKVL